MLAHGKSVLSVEASAWGKVYSESVRPDAAACLADQMMGNHSDLCLQMSSPAILSDRIDTIWDIMQRNDAR